MNKKRFVFYTRDDSFEYWLRIEINLQNGNSFILEGDSISFYVTSYEVDDLYSSTNWEDAFKITKVCKKLTISPVKKSSKIKVDFPPEIHPLTGANI